MKVPFVDLKAQHNEVRDEIISAVTDIIDNSSFVGGPRVERFEKDFAEFCGVKFAAGCANGTDALKLALMAAVVGPGDEVITVSHTFVATAEAILLVGAQPVFIDIDHKRYTMDSQKLKQFLEGTTSIQNSETVNIKTGKRIGAILPVHLYGLTADMAPLLKLAHEYHIPVIEDACQAHGALCHINGENHRAGSLGLCGAFSFYPGKNLGAMGEAGAVVTNSEQANKDIHTWRDHGQSERYHHISPLGWNGRLDAMQAAILRIKLKKLDEWNNRRRQAALWYKEKLSGIDEILLPQGFEDAEHVYHLFVVRVKSRDSIQRRLAEQGVTTGLHYPIPIHLQQGFRYLGYKKGDLPITEEVAENVLSLPMYPHITEEQVEYVCQELKKCV